MRIFKNRKAARLLAILVIATIPVLLPAHAESRTVDPVAVKMLKGMTDYMGSLQSFSVHSQNTLEHQLDSGQRIDEDISVSMTLSRPGKLQAKRLGDQFKQVFYYNGKTLTLYDPVNNVYATDPAPATIEEMLDYARESLGLVIPASDLAYRNAYVLLMQGVTSAIVVGKANINGKICGHLAFSRPDVDFQVWVEEGSQPLPCKYVVTDKSAPALISTTSVLSDWNVKPSISDNSFNFVPGKGNTAIKFVPLEATDPGASK